MKDHNFYEEEYRCTEMYLDTLEIPTHDKSGNKYSLVGRIKQLEKIFYKKMSEVEDFYLKENS